VSRSAARKEILAAANRARREPTTPTLYMRHIERAVFRCRQRRLVSDPTLLDAGYRP
jgi:hypothetical protein